MIRRIILSVAFVAIWLYDVASATYGNKTKSAAAGGAGGGGGGGDGGGGLYWNDLSVQMTDGTFLLHNCHGFIADGHMCGILGPSGAGKVRANAMQFGRAFFSVPTTSSILSVQYFLLY